MRLFDRVSQMVKSDAHGIVDKLEERSLLLKQHLRDAELALSHKRAEAEALEEEERHLRDEADRLAARVAELDEDVELALAGGKDELARFAVRRLLPVREARSAVRAKIERVGETRARLGAELGSQEAQFEELSRGVEARLARARQEQAAPPPLERAVADEEVELELLRRARTAGAS